MPVKLRLSRKGRKKKPFYHIIVADSRSPRDGKFIEKIGSYNPLTKPATIEIDRDRAFYWLMCGAQPTDTVRAILRFKGVTYKKHLQLGVQKGAITQEQADAKLAAWTEAKEAKIATRIEKTKEDKKDFQKLVFGKPKEKPAPAPVVVEEVIEEVAVAEEPLVEETVVVVEEVATAPTVSEETTATEETAAPEAEEKPEEA
ncbi:MAG: 30S ribosomal protein S16 [Saprospiraceae bacterium]|nr:30S ribosomal protein S16 [Saprospiraceae bacterium]